MNGSGDEGELQMYDATRPSKRRGLFSLLGTVCSEQKVSVRDFSGALVLTLALNAIHPPH